MTITPTGSIMPPSEPDGALSESFDVDAVTGVWQQLANENVMFPMLMNDVATQIGSHHQLFVDNALIATASDVKRQVHQPRPHQELPVLASNELDNRVQVLHVLQFDQAPQFRMWYWSGYNWHAWQDNEDIRFATSYAVSDDGIKWERPDLNMFQIDQWFDKNIVLPYGLMHGLFHEPWEPDPNKRFKALVCMENRNRDTQQLTIPRGYYVHTSPDGIHWEANLSRCVIPMLRGYTYPQTGIGDTTRFWWDSHRKKYIGDAKFVLPGKLRCRGLMESNDLIHWTRPHPTLFAREGDQQIYGHRGFPYEGMYIGLRWLYRNDLDVHQCNHAMDVELDCSRDGRIWTRVGAGQAFMPYQDTWDGWSIKPTAMLTVDNEIWIYYTAKGGPEYRKRHDTHPGWSVGLVKLRQDGFASINADERVGHLVTRPLGFSGNRLHVNAEIEAGGSLRVGFRTADNRKVIHDRSLSEATPITQGNGLDRTVTWNTGDDISELSGTDARLEFEMQRAKLYSFWID